MRQYKDSPTPFFRFSGRKAALPMTFMENPAQKIEPRSCSVHGVVLGDDPFSILQFSGDGEEFFIRALLAGVGEALAAVMQDAQGWSVFPIDEFPGKQRMFGFGMANEGRIFFAVVLSPLSQFILALSVPHGADEVGGCVLGGPVPQRVQANGSGDTG